MGMEQRRFPRIDRITPEQILRLSSDQSPKQNTILTRNVSASGVCFTTGDNLVPGTFFLIYLNPQSLPEIGGHPETWVRSGDYYLARVVRAKRLQDDFEIGATFVNKAVCQVDELLHFTELMNARMLSAMNEDRATSTRSAI